VADLSNRGAFQSWLHRTLCRIFGHSWGYYRYPHGDGWFGGPHERRYCTGCYADEPFYDEADRG